MSLHKLKRQAVFSDLLTPKELEVAKLVVIGKTNREIGKCLDLAVRTVEIHRARVLKKHAVDSTIKLLRVVYRLE